MHDRGTSTLRGLCADRADPRRTSRWRERDSLHGCNSAVTIAMSGRSNESCRTGSEALGMRGPFWMILW